MSLHNRISGSLAALFLFLICSCKEKTEDKILIPEVKVVEAVSRTLPVYSEYNGETYGQLDVELFPRVEGWITGIHFREGQEVKEGQLLYTIDDTQLKNREHAAAARLAEQDVLLAKYKADLDRVEPLAAMNALSKRDLDAARAAYEAQKKSVEAARMFYENSKVESSYSRILSPFNGIIGVSRVQLGDYVGKGANSDAINTVSSIGLMRIRFTIPESDVLKYQKQAKEHPELRITEAQLLLNDRSVFPEMAKLDFADRSLDPRTGSLLVQASVENKSRSLRPGQFVKVRIKSSELDDAVLVPQSVVNQMQTIYQVYVVSADNTVQPRPVKAGQRVGSNWVITEGLKAGERVAVLGNAIVKPKSQVKPVPMAWSYDSTMVN